MLSADELAMYRYELDHNFPMFSEWEKEKPLRVLQHSQAAGGNQLLQGSYTASILSNLEVKHNGLCKNDEILNQQG